MHETWFFTEFIVFDCKILDGMTPFHLLNPISTNRFIDYIENLFICHIKRELECCYRIDIVWDQYFSHSIKESTTKNARSGVKKKLIKIKVTSWLAKFSNNWLNFRINPSNKYGLIKSLNSAISTIQVEKAKRIVTTSVNSMLVTSISVGNSNNIPNFNQEQADTRVFYHDLNVI